MERSVGGCIDALEAVKQKSKLEHTTMLKAAGAAFVLTPDALIGQALLGLSLFMVAELRVSDILGYSRRPGLHKRMDGEQWCIAHLHQAPGAVLSVEAAD